MPESLTQVRQALQNSFSSTFQASSYFETYVRMGSFLSDPCQYNTALIELEIRLEQARGERVDAIAYRIEKETKTKFKSSALCKLLTGIREDRFGKVPVEAMPYVGYAKDLYSKLLSGILFDWESTNGFTIDPNGKADILFGNPGRLFNQQLKDGRPFKDIGAGKEHGEFSHRIQWFLAGIGLKLSNAGALYRDVARWITTTTKPAINNRDAPVKRYLWEFLFDRDGNPSNASSVHFSCVDELDFRAPSNLNRQLMKKDSGVPILSWCMRDRFNKRTHQPPTMEYLAKKAPTNAGVKAASSAERKMISGKFEPDTDLPVLNRATAGLFVRRNGEVVDVVWQN